MSRRRPLARRSPADWAVRGLMATAAVVVGYVSVTHALAQAVAKGNVELAHRLAPGDGRITALLAASLAGSDATAADRRRAETLGRAALRQDPTAVAAVSTLGINAQVRGDTAAARRLFAYSQQLSRRDFQTQLWAIEDAVGRGEVVSALQHYDITLRTAPGASEILYPVLASATNDPAIREALLKTLVARPVWGESFVNYVAGKGADARSTLVLLSGLRRAGVPVSEIASTAMINALVAAGLLDQAWTYYTSLRPGADRRASRDPRFTATLTTPSALDWMPINGAGINASIQRGEGGGVVDFTASPNVGGAMLQQRQMLPPGDYRLNGHSIAIDQSEDALPYWVLICEHAGELGRVVVPNSRQAGGVFSGRFSVPAGCPVQTLVLVARPSDAAEGVSGQIDRALLSPAR